MLLPKKKIYKSKANYEKYREEHPNCEIPLCKENAWLGPHHITFRSQGGGDDSENLIRLCKSHHDDAHGSDSRGVRERLKALKEAL